MTLKKILLPLDGSTTAACVLPTAIAMVQATGAEVVLLNVLETTHEHGEAQVNPLDWHLRKIEITAYLNDVKQQLQEQNVLSETVMLEGHAAERIIDYAHQIDADLLIMSSHGQSGLTGWNINSISQKVIDRIRKSVMIVRAYHTAVPQYQRILVPLDGSQRAESVLPLATRLAQHHTADLLLTHIITAPEIMHRTPLSDADNALVEKVVERNKEEAQKYFAQLQARLPLPIQTHLLTNHNLSHSLHELIKQEEIDLVVVNAHGYSEDTQRPYGNLVNNLITYGTTPLLIVQDLPAQQIEPTVAEKAMRETSASAPAYRQPISSPSLAPAEFMW